MLTSPLPSKDGCLIEVVDEEVKAKLKNYLFFDIRKIVGF